MFSNILFFSCVCLFVSGVYVIKIIIIINWCVYSDTHSSDVPRTHFLCLYFKNLAQSQSMNVATLSYCSLGHSLMVLSLHHLKEQQLPPVFKSGPKTFPNNYRPISLTSTTNKVFERIIRKQIVAFLTRQCHLNNPYRWRHIITWLKRRHLN